MPDNAQRDANISRLFEKIDYVVDKVTTTQTDVSAIGVKIDDFSLRLRKLEERDEKHLEKEEQLQVLTARLEAIISNGEGAIEKLDEKLQTLESDFALMKEDIIALKKNWKLLMSIVSGIGAVAGFVIKTLIDIFGR